MRIENADRTATIYKRDPLKRQRRSVIIVLHGNAGNVGKVHHSLDIDRYVGDSGVTLVYPQAIRGKWSLTNDTDVEFVHDLTERLIRNGTAKPNHIFIAGVSTGGMLALRLACQYPQSYVGAAAVLANLPTAAGATCKPKHSIPLMLVNATNDAEVPYKGGPTKKLDYVGSVLSTEETLAPFAAANGCTGPMVARLGPIGKSKLRASFETYKSCKVPVQLIKIINGTHVIPGRHIGRRGKLANGAGSGVMAAHRIFSFSQRLR
ncbi:MAG: hypothetical protein KGJ29_09660 [Hyphomicrobiales bacterium]|nr:hypothetical protein [Hyphomicrobiales bacterium]